MKEIKELKNNRASFASQSYQPASEPGCAERAGQAWAQAEQAIAVYDAQRECHSDPSGDMNDEELSFFGAMVAVSFEAYALSLGE